MRSKDLNTLEKFLKEYGSKTPLSEYPTPVGQQSMGTVAKASKSPNTTKTASPMQKPSASPNTTGIKPKAPDAPQYVMRKASELEVDTEYKDDQGKVLGKIVSKVGDSPRPDGVVVQDPATKKYTVITPDETLSVDNPEIQEDSKPDPFDRLTKRKNKLRRKIKHLLRAQKYNEQGEPIFEINFNNKQVAQDALDAKVVCGFEAETLWPDISGEEEDSLHGESWSVIEDLVYDQEGSRSVDRIETQYKEWIMEDIIYQYESDVIQELVDDRKEQEGYLDDYVSNNIDDSEIEDYKEQFLDNMDDAEREEYEDWDTYAWGRQLAEEERQDHFLEWLADEIRDNGEAWDDAWERATSQNDPDDWIRSQYSGDWYSALSDLDIFISPDSGGGQDEVASLIEDWASNNSKSNDVRPGDYHSGKGVDNEYWRVEDDSSIDGDGTGAEIISPVYSSPREMLKEMRSLFGFLKNNNAETNDSTGLHVTMSWMGNDWATTNKLKIAVLLGDKYLLKQFDREKNSYTKSQMDTLQKYMQNLQTNINDQQSLAALEEMLMGGLSAGKFSSINFKDAKNVEQNNLIEFRIAGGDDYHLMEDKIIKAVIRYGAVMQAGHDETAFRNDYIKALFRLLNSQTDVSTDQQRQAQQAVNPDTVDDKVLTAFKSLTSKKHYKDAIEAIGSAYNILAQANDIKGPQQELQFEDDEEEDRPDWRIEMQTAQKYFVKALAILVSDVATGNNRSKPSSTTISALRKAITDFMLTPKELWNQMQQTAFVKNFPGSHHEKIEKMASALNALLKKKDAKAPEPSLTLNVGAGNMVLMPSATHKQMFGDIFDDSVTQDTSIALTKQDFLIVSSKEYDEVRSARREYEINDAEIGRQQEIIDSMYDTIKADPQRETDLAVAIKARQEKLAEWQEENVKFKNTIDTFVKKYGFAPASVKHGSEPIGPAYHTVHFDQMQLLATSKNIKFTDVQQRESVFAKFDRLPLEEKLALINKVDTVKLNEAWNKKNEAVLGPNPTSTSLPGYIQAINSILSSPNPVLKMGSTGAHLFTANPGQAITTTSDVITGAGKDHLGNNAQQVITKTLWKGQLKSTSDSTVDTPSANNVVFNRGEVAEAYHALAAFVRFVSRPTRDITLDDVVSWIPKLENGVTFDLKVTDAENQELADEFWVTVSLKPEQWTAFKQPEAVLADKAFAKIASDIVDDANQETGRRADKYATNGRYDLVRVIGDGVSGETETKTDIEFENETEKKHRGYSIKVGSVKQIHQVGGGAISGKRKASAEERYAILQDELFGVHGRFRIADISDARVAYLKAAKDESTQGRLVAQAIGYKAAVKSINRYIKTDDDEKKYVKLLAKAFKYFQARDDDRILLKQFTGTKKGTYILDPKRFNKLHKQGLNLVAIYDEAKENPEIAIIDQDSNKRLVTFRTYKTADGYMRNYIEKGDLWKELTNIAKVKESVREGQHLEEGMDGILKAFAIAGVILFVGADVVKGVEQKREWNAAYEEIKTQDPAKADEIKRLMRKYKMSVSNKDLIAFSMQYKNDINKIIDNFEKQNGLNEGAVPDNSTVRKLRELLSKPLLSGDLKGQMNAYVAIPDPSMIKDFRSARAMAGDEYDLRDVVRNYAKAKLHPDVLRKIK